MRQFLCGLVTIAGCAAFVSDAAQFNAEKFLIIDGEPRLILGLYENPDDDAVLAEAVAAGFNFFSSKASRDSLDRLQAHGARAWIPLGGRMALPEGDAAARQTLETVVNDLKDHPALLSWEAPDESLWNEWYCANEWAKREQAARLDALIKEKSSGEVLEHRQRELARAVDLFLRGLWKESEEVYGALWQELGEEQPHPELAISRRIESAEEMCEKLERGWQVIRELDDAHVLWQNHAPRNSIADLRAYNKMVDAAGCDIYPAPCNYRVGHSDLRDMTLTSVGAYTERMRAGAPGKACWMVLQGFGWRDISEGFKQDDDPASGRRPNWQETRFMAYDSLLHGATAILYWGTAFIEKDSELWGEVLRIARELRALEPAIVGTRPQAPPVAIGELTSSSFDGDQPRLMLRQWTGESGKPEWALITINECYSGVPFRVTGLPSELEGRQLFRLYTDETVTVKDGGFRDGIRGYDVHVYATTKTLEAK